MHTHANKTRENKTQLVANKASQKQSGSESAFQFTDNRPEAITQRKLKEMTGNSPQAKKVAQLQAMAVNHTTSQNNNGKVKQFVKEINHVSEDTSGVCGYMALHAAFTTLNPKYNKGKNWALFKKENPTIIKNDATSICTIDELLTVIKYYGFVGIVHGFKNGPELVEALKKTAENPVLIGHTLLSVPQRASQEKKTAGDRAHWSVISKVKENIITMWDNWCDGGEGVRDKPYEIEAQDLAEKSLILEGQTHEYPLLSNEKIKERKTLDIHGRLVEVKLG